MLVPHHINVMPVLLFPVTPYTNVVISPKRLYLVAGAPTLPVTVIVPKLYRFTHTRFPVIFGIELQIKFVPLNAPQVTNNVPE